MNCCVLPWVIERLYGVTEIETNVAGVTVSASDPVMLPDVAVIVVEPGATDVANPGLLITATARLDEFQIV